MKSIQQIVKLNIEQVFQQAFVHHQAGRLHEVELLSRSILQAQLNYTNANDKLGVLAAQAQQPIAVFHHFKTALEANPNQGQCWLSYIDALIQAGQPVPFGRCWSRGGNPIPLQIKHCDKKPRLMC